MIKMKIKIINQGRLSKNEMHTITGGEGLSSGYVCKGNFFVGSCATQYVVCSSGGTFRFCNGLLDKTICAGEFKGSVDCKQRWNDIT